MFNLNLNGSTRSVDLSILNSSALDSPTIMMGDLQNLSGELGAPIELTKKYYRSVDLSSYSSPAHSPPLSDSLTNLSGASSSSTATNLVHQLTTIVNDLVIDTLLTNSTSSLLANASSNNSFGSAFNQTASSQQICLNNSTCK